MYISTSTLKKVNLSSSTPFQPYFPAFFYSIFSFLFIFPVLLSGLIPLPVLFFAILLQPYFSFIPIVSSDFPTSYNFVVTKYSTNFSHSYCSSHCCSCLKNVSFPLHYFQISIPMLFPLITHLNSSAMNSASHKH